MTRFLKLKLILSLLPLFIVASAIGEPLVGNFVHAYAQSASTAPNAIVIPPSGGNNYGVLSNSWWQWALSSPLGSNPVNDPTGVNCGFGQSGSVWFLAGVFGTGSATRNDCMVPPGKRLFIPIWNIVSIATDGTPPQCPPNGENAAQLRNDIAMAIQAQDPTTYQVQVDGTSIPISSTYRAGPSNPSFYLHNLAVDTFNHFFGTQCTSLASQYLTVSDGYYLMLAPLTPGKHTIHFQVPNSQDITYNLTVSR